MAEKLWKVLSNSDPSRIRTLFQGLEKDARAFIESHYPRAHVEPPSQDPGVPDVKLVSPDGAEDTYHAEEGWASDNPDNQPEEVPADGDDKQPVRASGFNPPPGQKSSPELL
jgi:hypothetical protein